MLTVAEKYSYSSKSDVQLSLSFAFARDSRQISIRCSAPEAGRRYTVKSSAHPAWAFVKQKKTVLEKLVLTVVSGMFCKELRMIRCKFKPFGSEKARVAKPYALPFGTAMRLRL